MIGSYFIPVFAEAGATTYESALTLSTSANLSYSSLASFVSSMVVDATSTISDGVNADFVVSAVAEALSDLISQGYITTNEVHSVLATASITVSGVLADTFSDTNMPAAASLSFSAVHTALGSLDVDVVADVLQSSLGSFGVQFALAVAAQLQTYGTKLGEAFLAYLAGAIIDE